MNIKIDINTPLSNMTEEQTQKIKRVANVLRDAGFKVELIWHETLKAEE